jgi:hypothetical protein
MGVQAMSGLLWTGFTGLVLCVLVIHLTGALVRRTERAHDRQLRRQWQEDIASAELPPWDGQAWDWPETGLARYLFGQDEEEIPAPCPPAESPGAEPGTDWADQVIASMQAQTDAFIAAMSRPQSEEGITV